MSQDFIQFKECRSRTLYLEAGGPWGGGGGGLLQGFLTAASPGPYTHENILGVVRVWPVIMPASTLLS